MCLDCCLISLQICVRSDDDWVAMSHFFTYNTYCTFQILFRTVCTVHDLVGCGFCQVQQVIRSQEALRKFIAMNVPLHHVLVVEAACCYLSI